MYFFGNCAQWVSNNTWCITEKVSNLFCLTYNACFSVIGSFQLPNWIFLFVLNYFHYYSSNVHYCEDCFHIHVFIRSSNIWLSHILSRLCWTVLQINVRDRGGRAKTMIQSTTSESERCWIVKKEKWTFLWEKKARSDLAAKKYVIWYLTSVFSQTFYSRGV